ncbi:MAG: hypothetical protein WDM86_05915 [Rhizomicrobium sp.]
MKAEIVAPLVGIVAAVLLAAAYFAPPYLGVAVEPAKVLAIGVILTAGASLAVLVFMAMNPSGHGQGGRASTYSPLNEPPVLPFIALFRDPEIATVTVTATPGDLAGDLLARHAEALKNPEQAADKRFFLVLKAGRKTFNPLEIKSVFAKLLAFRGFYHVLLMSEKDEYVGYIPVEGCKKDFTGENAETKITKYIVEVLADPKKSESLRALKGAAQDDTVEQSVDIRDAARKMWLNEKIQALVVCRRAKPIGVLDKQSVLTLTATGA